MPTHSLQKNLFIVSIRLHIEGVPKVNEIKEQIHEKYHYYLGKVETSLPEHKYVPEYLNCQYF